MKKDIREIEDFMGAKEIVDDFFDCLDVITDEYKNEVIVDDKRKKLLTMGKHSLLLRVGKLLNNPKINVGIKVIKRLTFTKIRV